MDANSNNSQKIDYTNELKEFFKEAVRGASKNAKKLELNSCDGENFIDRLIRLHSVNLSIALTLMWILALIALSLIAHYFNFNISIASLILSLLSLLFLCLIICISVRELVIKKSPTPLWRWQEWSNLLIEKWNQKGYKKQDLEKALKIILFDYELTLKMSTGLVAIISLFLILVKALFGEIINDIIFSCLKDFLWIPFSLFCLIFAVLVIVFVWHVYGPLIWIKAIKVCLEDAIKTIPDDTP